LVKIGVKGVRRGRYVTFQLAGIAIPETLFADILRRINRLRPKPLPTSGIDRHSASRWTIERGCIFIGPVRGIHMGNPEPNARIQH